MHHGNTKKVLDAIAVKHKIPLIDAAVRAKSAHIAGIFGCLGFDTFGLFKLVGGIAKGRPNQEDLDSASAFMRRSPYPHSAPPVHRPDPG